MPDHDECILIVEDSEFNAQVLAKTVSQLAPVIVAASGNEALDLMRTRVFDVVLLDITLPDIDGFEVCRKIVEAQGPDAPSIIFVTSKDNVEDEEKGLSLGAVDYLYKPVVGSIVQAKVKNYLSHSRARRDLIDKNAELNELATIDSLTETYNRRHFYELVDKEISRATRYDQDYAVIALDLDHFKSINDTHGHDRGDAVLKAATNAWAGVLRANDILGRIGGEEFSIFLPQTNKEQAMVAAERLLGATRDLGIPDGNGGSIGVTVSMGLAFPSDDCSQSINICADKALYEAKNAGRDRAAICSRTDNCVV
ncbi:MAG: diguanylate cyclase, partial [Rhodospirillaceae bacterium]|nr:diguanylate cyclase [Rhodospirillaceae bacterium]